MANRQVKLIGSGRILTRDFQIQTPRPHPLGHHRSLANRFCWACSNQIFEYGRKSDTHGPFDIQLNDGAAASFHTTPVCRYLLLLVKYNYLRIRLCVKIHQMNRHYVQTVFSLCYSDRRIHTGFPISNSIFKNNRVEALSYAISRPIPESTPLDLGNINWIWEKVHCIPERKSACDFDSREGIANYLAIQLI